MMPTEDVIRLMQQGIVLQAERATAQAAWYRAKHLGDQDTMDACEARDATLRRETADNYAAIRAAEKAP